MANNHLGSLDRGLKIIKDHGQIVRYNNVKAAIKLQFRDVENFIHDSFKNLDDRYIKKTQVTYNYKEDAGKWKHIADNSVITKFVQDNIYKLKEYSTNRITDAQYGFYGNPYNTDKVSWWNFQDFYTNLYLGKKMALSTDKGGVYS